jgi:hypothetical protein
MQIHLFNAIHNILIYIHIIFMFIDVSAAKVLQKRCPSRLSIESWIFSWAMSRRFQFPFTDFSLVMAPPSRRYFQGHSPRENPTPLQLFF